ncbi:hypothetical protein PIB30_040589 [Stylosanthes scabra]|uniref:Uncharacterized protein n=1 Tax=Stylosanthes scabra TaxID=79078 RepID=A0ABU6ZDC8_9FABA|nr:hypothetical protein [Stylosanthes scabra]
MDERRSAPGEDRGSYQEGPRPQQPRTKAPTPSRHNQRRDRTSKEPTAAGPSEDRRLQRKVNDQIRMKLALELVMEKHNPIVVEEKINIVICTWNNLVHHAVAKMKRKKKKKVASKEPQASPSISF